MRFTGTFPDDTKPLPQTSLWHNASFVHCLASAMEISKALSHLFKPAKVTRWQKMSCDFTQSTCIFAGFIYFRLSSIHYPICLQWPSTIEKHLAKEASTCWPVTLTKLEFHPHCQMARPTTAGKPTNSYTRLLLHTSISVKGVIIDCRINFWSWCNMNENYGMVQVEGHAHS